MSIFSCYPVRVLSTQGLLTTDRVPQWGLVKIFREENRLPRSNGRYSKTKRDIVMGLTAKAVTTHRASNAPLTKIWLPKQKMRRLGPILGRGTFCNFWYQYSLFVFRIGDFFSGMLNKDQSVLVVNIESVEIKTLSKPSPKSTLEKSSCQYKLSAYHT